MCSLSHYKHLTPPPIQGATGWHVANPSPSSYSKDTSLNPGVNKASNSGDDNGEAINEDGEDDQADDNKGEDVKANDSDGDPDNDNGKDMKDQDDYCEDGHASNNKDETTSCGRDDDAMPSTKWSRDGTMLSTKWGGDTQGGGNAITMVRMGKKSQFLLLFYTSNTY